MTCLKYPPFQSSYLILAELIKPSDVWYQFMKTMKTFDVSKNVPFAAHLHVSSPMQNLFVKTETPKTLYECPSEV